MIAKIEIEAALTLLKECRFSGFSNLESKNSLRVNAAKRHLEKVLAGEECHITVTGMAENCCKHLPVGWGLALHMENGSAWVELETPRGGAVTQKASHLLDSADKDLYEQINDALNYANGFR